MAPESASRIPLNDLLVFHQLTRSLNSSFDLDAILRTILDQMERLIEAELWTLLMLDESRQELYYALAAGGDEGDLSDLRVKVGEGVAGWVAQHGEALILPGDEEDSRLQSGSRERLSAVRSVVALPLKGRKGTHGVIEIVNPRFTQLTDYTIAFLHILADHAAIAIENARDVTQIQRLTITDDTTGLFNVRHLYEVLGRELERCLPLGLPVSLAFLDLDRFKLVNDAYGHLVGSELLAQTGRRLRELSRPQDCCFRYGGDEFVLLMPETSAGEALAQASQLLEALMDTHFLLKNGHSLSVSASIGVATSPADGASIHTVIGTADNRMYKVKRHGRGRVRGD
jgi:diguanylate cyclase (GGDEF)-like protein